MASSRTFYPRKLTPAQRAAIMGVLAGKFESEHTKARLAADEDLDFGRDTSCAVEEACEVDTALLPKSKRARVEEAFGCKNFKLDSTDLYMTKEKQYRGTEVVEGVSVTELHANLYKQRKTFVAKADMVAPGADSEKSDEMVAVKIGLGKGGVATFMVKKSDARDMI